MPEETKCPNMNSPNSPQSQAEAMAREIVDGAILDAKNNGYAVDTKALGVRISTALSTLIAENERLKLQWEHESCERCGYMRSPVAPCKCGQLVMVGTNDRLRSQLTATEAKLSESVTLLTACQGVAMFKSSEFKDRVSAFLSTLTAEKKESE